MTQRLAFYILAVLCLVFIIYHASARASTPYELNYEEGNILNAGVRIVNGSGAYPDPRSFPYTLNPYGPVGYLLTAAVIRAFGVSLFAPRMLVLLAGDSLSDASISGSSCWVAIHKRRLGGSSARPA